MIQTDFSLPVQYTRQIADQVSRMGAALPPSFQRYLGEPGKDVVEKIPFAVFQDLVRTSMQLTAEPAMGLLVGERLLVHSHGLLGYAALSSASLRQLIELFERYLQVRTNLLVTRHQIVGQDIRFHLEEAYPLDDIRQPVMEAVVLTIKNLVDYVTMGTCPVTRVCFALPEPDYIDLARDLFRTEVHYGANWTGLTIPVSALDQPLKMADPAAFADAMSICQRELDKITRPQSLAARVRRLLLEKQGSFPSLNVAARLFHMTPRTLHRRLTEEGTSYRGIVEGVRHMLAVEHLKSGHLSIQQITYMLDYTDISNFRRAFKRWEGVAPSEYRGAVQATAVSVQDFEPSREQMSGLKRPRFRGGSNTGEWSDEEVPEVFARGP
ncbi:MAG: AraC family transcriptional regulator [Aquabacterium sp.]|jgi:AraC-like DNA-binding protein|uniref:AraC family transcriptional regulator n=1 Tax=Aquabacterium sp. TaxID=1872578 RepID=UPI001D5FE0F2|nr:AraC family transcriptional regulator [Aquabacterium sp.]MBT9610378.1 AraC family transcriptional regulator [Aquabacterium sp.]